VVVDEERRPDHWLGSVLCVFLGDLTLHWLYNGKGIWPIKRVPLIPKGCLSEQMEEEHRGPLDYTASPKKVVKAV